MILIIAKTLSMEELTFIDPFNNIDLFKLKLNIHWRRVPYSLNTLLSNRYIITI